MTPAAQGGDGAHHGARLHEATRRFTDRRPPVAERAVMLVAASMNVSRWMVPSVLMRRSAAHVVGGLGHAGAIDDHAGVLVARKLRSSAWDSARWFWAQAWNEVPTVPAVDDSNFRVKHLWLLFGRWRYQWPGVLGGHPPVGFWNHRRASSVLACGPCIARGLQRALAKACTTFEAEGRRGPAQALRTDVLWP